MQAQLYTLREGSPHGELVIAVQQFLRGADLYLGEIDGKFGPILAKAVRDFQDDAQLKPDGVIGNRTWGAMLKAGLPVLESEDDSLDEAGANWPPRPALLRSLTAAQREQRFGRIVVRPTPVPGNPEAVEVLSSGPEYQIVVVECATLKYVEGFPRSGKILMHAAVAQPFQELVAAWAAAGLLPKIRTWAGSLVTRYVRGSRTTLSPHAWGTAFDINVKWNALGAEPTLAGRMGSVRELVPLAVQHGFYWGGWFKRLDGMHFEYVGKP